MASINNKDVFVVQHPNGWAVKKSGADRASAVLPTKREALERAKKVAGKRPVRAHGRDGKFKAQ